MILLLKLKIYIIKNAIHQFRTSEKMFALVSAIGFLFFAGTQSRILPLLTVFLRERNWTYIQNMYILIFSSLFPMVVFCGLFFTGRYQTSSTLDHVRYLPVKKGHMELYAWISELLDPCIVLSLALVGGGITALPMSLFWMLCTGIPVLVFYTFLVIITKKIIRTIFAGLRGRRLYLFLGWALLFVLLFAIIGLCSDALTTMYDGKNLVSPESTVGVRILLSLPTALLVEILFAGTTEYFPIWQVIHMTAFILLGYFSLKLIGLPQTARNRKLSCRTHPLVSLMTIDSWIKRTRLKESPLISKEILYFLRCNRTMLAYILGIAVTLFLGYPLNALRVPISYSWESFVGIAGMMSTVIMSNNMFAFEGRGLSVFKTAPLEGRHSILRIKRVSSFIFIFSYAAVLMLISFFMGENFVQTLSVVLFTIIPSSILLISLGSMISLVFPMKVAFDSISGQVQPFYSMVIAFAALFVLSCPFILFEEYVLLMPWYVLAAANGGYAVVLYTISRLLITNSNKMLLKHWDVLCEIIYR